MMPAASPNCLRLPEAIRGRSELAVMKSEWLQPANSMIVHAYNYRTLDICIRITLKATGRSI